MEKSINLEDLIDRSELSRYEIAVRLFPNNKYPEASLLRVIKGESFLDTNQILVLSDMLDVSVSDIFSNSWKGSISNGLHTISTGSYKAILDIEKKQTKLFHNDALIFETILHSVGVPLNDYLAMLNEQIEKHTSN